MSRDHSKMLKEGGMIIGSVLNGTGAFEKEKRSTNYSVFLQGFVWLRDEGKANKS